MKPNAMKTAMIRSAVKKGISDIKDDPGRGIRNLVEMGEMFAGGRFQKEFFGIVMEQLRDENSTYYRLVEQIVRDMDAEMLTEFGINLGYNALSHGATIIRGIEDAEGFNVPWCLVMDTGYEGKVLLPFDIEGVMEEGKELGIYCYLVYVDAGYPEFSELMEIMARQKDCAIVLFIDAQRVKNSLCDELLQARNVVPMIDLDDANDAAVQQAATLLLAKGCLCGGFSRQSALDADEVVPAILERAEALSLPIFNSVRAKRHHPRMADDVYNRFVLLRENLSVPVLPIDLYGDIAHADRAISTEACLAAVKGDGSLAFTNVDEDEVVSRFNIHDCSLRDALRQSLPKGNTIVSSALA